MIYRGLTKLTSQYVRSYSKTRRFDEAWKRPDTTIMRLIYSQIEDEKIAYAMTSRDRSLIPIFSGAFGSALHIIFLIPSTQQIEILAVDGYNLREIWA